MSDEMRSLSINPDQVLMAAPTVIALLRGKKSQAVAHVLNTYKDATMTDRQLRDRVAELSCYDSMLTTIEQELDTVREAKNKKQTV